MDDPSWPFKAEINSIRRIVSEMAGRGAEQVQIVVSPYRICPLGAHIDHQGGTVSAMTINKGILLGFIPCDDPQVVLRSGQFKGEVRFSGKKIESDGILNFQRGVIGYICGSEGMDSSGLSSSAAVGVAYLLALEKANNLTISPSENIEYDSGAGFRGCCLAIVDAVWVKEAVAFVKEDYYKLQPELASHINKTAAFVICKPDHSARVI